MRTPLIVLALFATALSVSACNAVKPLSIIGDQCDLTSECQAPLVCGLGRCRKECEASRDCALGLRCIKLPELSGSGVCQLPEEKSCSLNSDCESPLRCFARAGCLLPCGTDADCAPGATCEEGECEEPEVTLCVYNSDCKYPRICSEVLQQCIFECASVIDCNPGEECVQHEMCEEGPCMCRQPCDVNADCPLGSDCVACGPGLDCAGAPMYCERPFPDGEDAGVAP